MQKKCVMPCMTRASQHYEVSLVEECRAFLNKVNSICEKKGRYSPMKKRFLLGLAVLGTASMLCGFDSAETADSVFSKMQTASVEADNAAVDMDMNVDVSVNIGDGSTVSSIGIIVGGDFSVDTTMEPLAVGLEGSLDLSTFGQTQTLTMKMYSVTNEAGELESYIYTEDSSLGEGAWTYDNSGALGLDLDAVTEKVKDLTAEDFAEWGFEYTLAPEAADVDGVECYVLSSTIDADTFGTILDKASTLTGEDLTGDETVAQALALLEGLKIDMDYYVDAATYLPVKMHIDMNDSDLSTISQFAQAMLGASDDGETTIDIVINDLSFDAAMSYGTVEEIIVPEDALAAVEAGEASSVQDIVDAAM